MNRRRLKLSLWSLVSLLLGWFPYHPLEAGSGYVPYPGKMEVKVRQVDAANRVRVQFETWPGFYRDFQVTLPGIVVPRDLPDVSGCERRLAQKAKAFSENFLSQARAVYVIDMVMQNSASNAGEARIITDRGDLVEALQMAGLAQPVATDASKAWCQR